MSQKHRSKVILFTVREHIYIYIYMYFFRVLHASPAAVEIQEVDMGQQQFTSEHMVVELLKAVCPGLGASTLLTNSGSLHNIIVKALIARTTHHIRWTAKSSPHMVHPLLCDEQ